MATIEKTNGCVPPTEDLPPKAGINRVTLKQRMATYRHHPVSMVLLILTLLAILVTASFVAFLIGYIVVMGVPNLSLDLFSWTYTKANGSLMPALINTLIVTACSLILAVPIGIFAAIYLVEYTGRGNKLVNIIRLTTETLSGIPSIVYGLFGYLCFVTTFHWGYSLLSGSLTLAIMILPLIIRSTEEALRAVPDSYREGSFGLGAGRLRTVFSIILPAAIPGILSGVILAIGRIVGESAALIYTAGTVPEVASSLMDSTRTLAVHMWSLSSEGLAIGKSYATALVLLVIVVGMNGLSGFVAKKLAKG